MIIINLVKIIQIQDLNTRYAFQYNKRVAFESI